MKKLAIFCLVGLFSVYQLNAFKGILKSNYVVIGAFSIPKNAVEFTEMANKAHLNAQFSVNPNRKLFYVYVLATDDKNEAVEQAKKLRKETPYFDTWVYIGPLGDLGPEQTANGTDINPVNGNTISKIESADTKQINDPATTAVNSEIQKTEPATIPTSTIEEMPEGSKKFLFKIFTGEKALNGDVDVMDLEKSKARKMASYRGNEPVNVKPVNKSGNISFVCEVFGYRKMNYNVNFNDPKSTEGISEEEGKVVVPYDLVRLKKGDFAIMYNVFYYKDAAIMRPESRYEVTSLLEMLKENPKYKIRIHGHTNGNSSGKIISMGESKNYFSLNDTKDGHGSAKKLSEERARVIQNYLITQGIDAARMEIKAWGGKRPIYDEDHQLAQANVRVEIEILED
jgi:outer membrane protein OmpA-like peptidoglycan-associated protein